MRFRLFHQLFWPVLGVIGVTMSLLVLFSSHFFQATTARGWRQDLQQEAEWTAIHFQVVRPGMQPPPGHVAPVSSGGLAAAWRATHDSVRLTVFDRAGHVVMDSDPSRPPPPADGKSRRRMLAGSAPVRLPDGMGTLVLTRRNTPDFPTFMHSHMVIWVIILVLLAAAAVYPLVRHLTRNFERLSALARRVADGGSGATMEMKGTSELADLVASFNHMSLRLHDEELRRRRLIADVSHELRSPLARVRALAETIARRPRESAAHLARIEAEVALMDRLVGDLLDAAHIEGEGATLDRRRQPLASWAEDAFDRMRRRIEGDGAACDARIDAGGLEADIDGDRLLQTLANLVENALNATRGQADRRIGLSLLAEGATAVLTVSDNGHGVPEEDLPFVFDRFFRVERDRGRKSGGVGLGLSIAKAIVEAHGGRISLESPAGQGVTARIVLPTVS